MNKKDPRYVKTEKNIKEVFLDLKCSKAVVRIKDICEKAFINRSTFYSHYDDITSLERTVQRNVVKELLSGNEAIQNIHADIVRGCDSLFELMQEKAMMLHKVFNSSIASICSCVEEEILNLEHLNDVDQMRKKEVCFAIGGVMFLLKTRQISSASDIGELVNYMRERCLAKVEKKG